MVSAVPSLYTLRLTDLPPTSLAGSGLSPPSSQTLPCQTLPCRSLLDCARGRGRALRPMPGPFAAVTPARQPVGDGIAQHSTAQHLSRCPLHTLCCCAPHGRVCVPARPLAAGGSRVASSCVPRATGSRAWQRGGYTLSMCALSTELRPPRPPSVWLPADRWRPLCGGGARTLLAHRRAEATGEVMGRLSVRMCRRRPGRTVAPRGPARGAGRA